MRPGLSLRHVEQVMGTAVSFTVRDPIDPGALDTAVAWLHWVDATFSTHRHDSVISRLGRRAMAERSAPSVVRTVLDRCDEIRRSTDGWFEHEPLDGGPLLDPSAYVKGWSIDRAAHLLRQAGAERFVIGAGGDVLAAGGSPDDPWRIGVQHPARPDATVAVLPLAEGAVATSGLYERGAHIWPPHADRSLASVTVIGPELGTADALATALFAADSGFADWLARFPGYAVLAVDRAGEVMG